MLTFGGFFFFKRINEEILKGERAGYGKEILATLSQELVLDYGSGFSAKNICHMMKFANAFSAEKIVVSLARQLSMFFVWFVVGIKVFL